MCIVNGGVKMSMKGKGRMKKMNNYVCKNDKCNKLWSLGSHGVVITGGRRIRTGDRRNPYRSEGTCNCGTAFEVPHIYVNGSD